MRGSFSEIIFLGGGMIFQCMCALSNRRGLGSFKFGVHVFVVMVYTIATCSLGVNRNSCNY